MGQPLFKGLLMMSYGYCHLSTYRYSASQWVDAVSVANTVLHNTRSLLSSEQGPLAETGSVLLIMRGKSLNLLL